MAKTIKFNLILDEHPVRDIEGLQEHFSVEDMLKYFENGLLLRWLRVRGFDEEYSKVADIDKSSDKKSIILQLIKIFGVEDMKDSEVEKSIHILSYLEQERELNAIYEKNSFDQKKVIDDYHCGYVELVRHMEENSDNLALLKADAFQMERSYMGLFRLDYSNLYIRLKESAPKAIFAILSREAFRKFWIEESEFSQVIYKDIKRYILPNDRVKEILGEDLKIVKRNTQAMWDPIERKTVKIMVISIDSGAFVKNEGEFSEKLSYTDVNDKLLLFNGLEYQCNSEYSELLYMEV